MSEQVQHAAGPVTLDELTWEGPAIRNRAGIIAVFKPNPFPQHWVDEHPQALANARRGAALWNACEGIPTEALEAGVVREMVEVLEKAKATLAVAVRAGLRGFLDEEVEEIVREHVVIRQIDAVLAKVRGEGG